MIREHEQQVDALLELGTPVEEAVEEVLRDWLRCRDIDRAGLPRRGPLGGFISI